MPRAKNTKVWNEDLVTAFEARAQQALAQGKSSHLTWKKAAQTVAAVRSDIYQASTGRTYGLPEGKLGKNALALARDIMQGRKNVLPDGYVPTNQEQATGDNNNNNWDSYPYLKRIKMRGGAYAILMAFHNSSTKTLDKSQICQLAQPYCDEEMESNWHAGRAHGAWKSHETLLTHNLLVKEGGRAQFVAGVGFRSNGPLRLTLTRDGEHFIDALLRKFHDGEERQSAGAAHFKPEPESSYGGFRTPSSTPRRKPKTHLMEKDQEELRQWIASAPVNAQYTFKISKERRSSLHDYCDELEQTRPGLKLHHSSAGQGRSRIMFLTLVKQQFDGGKQESSSMKRPILSGHTLGSPDKKIRLSAQKAAANAALKRAAESSKRVVKKVDHAVIEESMVFAAESKRTQPKVRRKLFEAVEAPVEILSDSDDDEIPKPSIFASKQATVEIDLSDNENEKHKAHSKPRAKPAVLDLCGDERKTTAIKNPPCDPQEVIFIDSDDEEIPEAPPAMVPIVKNPYAKETSMHIANPYAKKKKSAPIKNSSLTFCIDNRERNKNATPRLLRTELTRLMKTGPLKGIWPSTMEDAAVEEVQLRFGDFSFQVGEKRIDVAVERKQIRDLVQRSTRGDHWKQLGKMRDNFRHSILLIEVDSRHAARFEAHGSQNLETWNPFNTVVDDEGSFFLFLGRALLSHRSVKFIQTREFQSSLRAIGTLGLMAASLELTMEEDAEQHAHPADETARLLKQLTDAGVPPPLADQVAREYGSMKHLKAVYDACEDDGCRSNLLIPLVKHADMGDLVDGSDVAWSEAVFRSLDQKDAASTAASCQKLKSLVEDHGELLCALHKTANEHEALDSALSASKRLAQKRHVNIDMCKEQANLLPTPTENSFFSVNSFIFQPLGASIPTLIFRTTAGSLLSSKLVVQIISGTSFVTEAKSAMSGTDYVKAARVAAASIMKTAKGSKTRARRVLIVRGLLTALEAEAKKAGYRPELKTLVDLVSADLMLEHDVVIIQALRLNGDVELILQQLALACFHYQLLTETKK